MLTLYFSPGACSMAAHIVLEESGEKYQSQQVHFADAEQRSEAYLKINPQGRVPAMVLDDGEPLAENTAILPYLGKTIWTLADRPHRGSESSLTHWLSGNHRSSFRRAYVAPRTLRCRPFRVSSDTRQRVARRSTGISNRSTASWQGAHWFSDQYSVADPYLLVFYPWGLRRGYPMQELKNFAAFKDSMLQRPAVQHDLAKEKIKL